MSTLSQDRNGPAPTAPCDAEILAHEVARAVNRYIDQHESDPEGHAREWSNLADTYATLGRFLIRSRPRRIA